MKTEIGKLHALPVAVKRRDLFANLNALVMQNKADNIET